MKIETHQWDKAIARYKKELNELLGGRLYSFNGVKKKDMPEVAGTYAIFENDINLLYIGQSKRLRGRLIDDHLQNDMRGSALRRNLAQHYDLKTEAEITRYIRVNCSFRYLVLDKPKALEHFAIAILNPLLNK